MRGFISKIPKELVFRLSERNFTGNLSLSASGKPGPAKSSLLLAGAVLFGRCCFMKKDASLVSSPVRHSGLNACVSWLRARTLMARLPVPLLLAAAGLSAQTAPPDPAIKKIVAEISPDRIAANVKTLAGFETRGNYSDPNQKTRGIGAARRWIFAQFHGYSQRLEVSYDIEKKGATDIVSVIAVLPGTAEPEKRIIVSAHYDSINLRATGDKAAEAPAPGADDDASGIAVVLELARVMSQYRFRKTIVFIAFGGEEIGLVGSSRYAARAKANNEQIEAVFNNDIVGSNCRAASRTTISAALTMTPAAQTAKPAIVCVSIPRNPLPRLRAASPATLRMPRSATSRL